MKLGTKVRLSFKVRSKGALIGFLLALVGVFPIAVAIGSVVLAMGALALAASAMSVLVSASRSAPAVVAIEDRAIVIGEVRLPRAEIEQGYVVPGPLHPRVTIETRRAVATIDVRDEDEARALLAALGLGMERRFASFSGVARVGTRSGLAAAFAVLAGVGTIVAGAMLALPLLSVIGGALAAAFVAFAVPSRIRVGADGIAIQNRFDVSTYRFADVVSVSPSERGIELHVSGRKVPVPLVARYTLGPLEREARDALVERIREGIARHATTDDRAADAHRLDRGKRPIAEWIASLVAAEEGDFRTAPLRSAELEAVLDDGASQAATRRIGAAVALSRRGDDARARVRVAAETTAAPKLRVALEAIASDAEGAVLARAIEEAEEESRAAEARATRRRD